MLDAASPVIQVVTTGVDWPAIAAAGATAVAAVGGIWGTARQARRSREATSEDLKKNLAAANENLRLSIGTEDKRSLRTEKRQVYAQCQAAFSHMMTAVILARPEEAEKALYDAITSMEVATSEVQLIAPRSVSDLAYNVKNNYINFVGHTYSDAQERLSAADPIRDGISKLYEAMRDDLGTS